MLLGPGRPVTAKSQLGQAITDTSSADGNDHDRSFSSGNRLNPTGCGALLAHSTLRRPADLAENHAREY